VVQSEGISKGEEAATERDIEVPCKTVKGKHRGYFEEGKGGTSANIPNRNWKLETG